ncbi:MAG: class II aldolase/adducin family protein, partial [Proteobacteria bacterium]|nr:class II aldolase/adducin family protein [Pseudomonadota bacterium]
MKRQTADALRAPLLQTARAMTAAGLNVGTAGNASVRLVDELQAGALLITPSGLAAERCTEHDMVVLRADGSFDGVLAPSSEWQLHRDIYAAFPDAGAILHAHAPFATALACQRGDIPP